LGLRLTTFSRPRLADESGKTISLSEKGLTALAYLFTLKDRRVSRGELAEFLWGDPEQSNTAGNLRQFLARIRSRQIEEGFEVFGFAGAEILLLSHNVTCDIDEFPRHVGANPFEALETALSIITGEFLAGVAMESAKGELWVESIRTRHREFFVQAISAATWNSGGSNTELVREACLRLLALDSFNTTAHQVLLRIYSQSGQTGQARVLFARYQERIRQELGAAPEPELVSLMQQLFPARSAAATRTENPDTLDNAATQQVLPRLLILPPSKMPGMPAVLATVLLEDVTIALCQARTLAIVAPHTARKIAHSCEGRIENLTGHSVGYTLETQLRQQGADLLLFCSLTDVRSDALMWANRFNVSAGHLSRSYRDVVLGIVASATSEIEKSEFEKITNLREPTAYQHYLLGQHNLRSIDLAHIRRARKMFRNSLHAAPGFPNALSGLARAEHLEWLVTARGDDELLRSSEHHAREAIKADPNNPGGYHQLGVTRLYDSDFDESVSVFEEAERLSPSHADLIADYADTLVHASDPQLAIEKIEKAIDLNPLCPDVYWWTAAGAHYCLGKFESSLECVAKMDDRSGATRLAAACWGMLGDTAKAGRLMRKTMKVYPDFEIEKWLAIMPVKENWQKEQYREGLRRAGFR
jgi:DNA-binding SARP family transcriptional activator